MTQQTNKQLSDFKKVIPQPCDRLQEAIWQSGVNDKIGNKIYDAFIPELNKLTEQKRVLREALGKLQNIFKEENITMFDRELRIIEQAMNQTT